MIITINNVEKSPQSPGNNLESTRTKQLPPFEDSSVVQTPAHNPHTTHDMSGSLNNDASLRGSKEGEKSAVGEADNEEDDVEVPAEGPGSVAKGSRRRFDLLHNESFGMLLNTFTGTGADTPNTGDNFGGPTVKKQRKTVTNFKRDDKLKSASLM